MLASSRAAQFNSRVSNLTRCYMQRQKAARISFNVEGLLMAESGFSSTSVSDPKRMFTHYYMVALLLMNRTNKDPAEAGSLTARCRTYAFVCLRR